MKKITRYFIACIMMPAFLCMHSCRRQITVPAPVLPSMNGVARSEAVTFTIGDTAYVGTGYDGTNRLADFWAYDAVQNVWSQIANFSGAPRNSAVAFAIGTQGFVGTGYDGNNMLADFCRWSQATNTWDSIAPFPGTGRYDAVAFGIGNYGYVATGYDGTWRKDFWQYDPSAGPRGAWIQQKDFGGEKRSAATAFVHGQRGYIVTGADDGVECGDFWYYDATLYEWTQLRNIYNSSTSQTYDDNYTNIERDNGVGFALGDSAFIATGENGGLITATWSYNFAEDQWVPSAPFPGPALRGAVGFAVKGKGYICTGKGGNIFYNNLYQFGKQ